jgi:hypothetical protein
VVVQLCAASVMMVPEPTNATPQTWLTQVNVVHALGTVPQSAGALHAIPEEDCEPLLLLPWDELAWLLEGAEAPDADEDIRVPELPEASEVADEDARPELSVPLEPGAEVLEPAMPLDPPVVVPPSPGEMSEMEGKSSPQPLMASGASSVILRSLRTMTTSPAGPSPTRERTHGR